MWSQFYYLHYDATKTNQRKSAFKKQIRNKHGKGNNSYRVDVRKR